MMRSGQILIELLLALAVATVTIVALAGVVTRSVSNAGFARSQSQASNLASEAIEWIRGYRDENGWSNFSFLNGDYCLRDLDWSTLGPPTCPPITVSGTDFTRKANLVAHGSSTDVAVTVTWSQRGKTYSARQTTVLSGF